MLSTARRWPRWASGFGRPHRDRERLGPHFCDVLAPLAADLLDHGSLCGVRPQWACWVAGGSGQQRQAGALVANNVGGRRSTAIEHGACLVVVPADRAASDHIRVGPISAERQCAWPSGAACVAGQRARAIEEGWPAVAADADSKARFARCRSQHAFSRARRHRRQRFCQRWRSPAGGGACRGGRAAA